MIYIMFILGFPKQAGFICAQLLALLFLRNSTEYENRCTQFRATEFRLETIVYTALYSILVCSHYIYYLQYFKWKLELPVSPLPPPPLPFPPFPVRSSTNKYGYEYSFLLSLMKDQTNHGWPTMAEKIILYFPFKSFFHSFLLIFLLFFPFNLSFILSL